jgi:hypothetical protein
MTDGEGAEAPARKSALARAWSGPIGTAVRVLFAVLPLGYLVKRLDLGRVFANAGSVGVRGVLASATAVLVTVVLSAVRWRLLLRTYGADETKLPGLFALTRAYLVGMYFNVLPSGVAGDVVRGWRVAPCVPSPATSYVVLLLERLSGLIGLLTVASIAGLLAPSGVRGGVVGYALAVGGLGAVGLGAVFFGLPQVRARSPWLRRASEALPVVGPIVAKIPAANGARGPLLALALSVLSQSIVVLGVAPLLMPLSPLATLGVCARIVPAVVLVTYIPLTPGGLGQREAAFAHFFGTVGIPREASVTASLLYFAVVLGISLLGGLVLAAERVAERRGASRSVAG